MKYAYRVVGVLLAIFAVICVVIMSGSLVCIEMLRPLHQVTPSLIGKAVVGGVGAMALILMSDYMLTRSRD